jgi:hypothetical protein
MLSQIKIKAKVEVILRPAVSRPVRLGVRHPSGSRDQFFFLHEICFRQLRVCYFVAPYLMRGRVCNLLLLLVLASTVPFGFQSRGTQDHILLSQFLRLPQPGGPGSRIYTPQDQGGLDIPPGTGFPFRRLLRLAGLCRGILSCLHTGICMPVCELISVFGTLIELREPGVDIMIFKVATSLHF